MKELDRLCYVNKNGPTPLPDWCRFLIHFGRDFSRLSINDKQLVTAIALPTRSYSAVLLSLGIVVDRITNTSHVESTLSKRLAIIKGINIGASVTLQDSGKQIKGKFLGIRDFGGVNRIGVYVPNTRGTNGLTRWFLPEKCVISTLQTGGILIFPNNRQDNNIVENQTFVSNFFTTECLWSLATESYLECLIIGHLNILNKEIKETELTITTDEICVEGELNDNHGLDNCIIKGSPQDILRVSNFLGSNKNYRTCLLPNEARSQGDLPSNDGNSIIIFDGARSFSKWFNLYPGFAKAVILDQTEPGFFEALQFLNSRFTMRIGDDISAELGEIPPGIELILFRDRT